LPYSNWEAIGNINDWIAGLMRFSKTNLPTATMGHPQDDGEAEQAQAEARRAEEIAQRRAYLEQKIFQAREAKRRAAEQAALEAARRPAPSQPAAAAPPLQHEPVRQVAPLVPPLVPAEMTVAPDWQKAFSLSPNVRFSRTPESLIPRKNPPVPKIYAPAGMRDLPQQPVPAPVSAAPSAQPAAQSVVRPPQPALSMPSGTIPAASGRPVVADVAQPSALIELEDFVPAIAAARAAVPPAAATPVGITVAAKPVSQLANLSDFAFWDVMPFEEGFASMPAPVPAPFVPFASPQLAIASETVLSLYRIIEWHNHAQSAPTVFVTQAVPIDVVPAADAAVPVAPVVAQQPVATVPEAQAVAVQPTVTAPLAPAAMLQQTVTEQRVIEQPAIVVAQVPDMPSPAAPAMSARPQLLQPAPRRDRAVAPAPMEWRPVVATTNGDYELPPRELLQEPVARTGVIMTQETLEQNAGFLESVLEDFGVKGEIIHVRPGPVVTLYEFEPAPGVKSARVIGLADDIARSMSALSARVAVVPGRNVIGIELPNALRETVYFRELIEAPSFESTDFKLALCLGKNIGGEPIIAELAKMPHLLVAGTTGSGKSVAINTMILSLLYRLTPEQCRLIMVDPKMLELSVYDGIPHLLTPVVTDPKKAVMALKWAVREMEDRYRKMSRLGVRNIDGYNARTALAREKGETINVVVQTGFDKGTGAPIEESQEMDLAPMPYIVVIVDEMADLMMVAGKEIEGAIQRLAQMARAAGIHLIMATQRPSVDVITGTIKANFPTRISFQVTSKIDSRTILGEQGAEQLLGQGDMLHMAGGGRISRVHGPFVSDEEVEKVVAHLKTQGRPEYLDTVTADEDEEDDADEGDSAVFDKTSMGSEDGDDLYEQAVKVVMRDKKCSTSYIQRRLGIGYNRAASLVERMEKEGLVGTANHVGKREIISGNRNATPAAPQEEED
jgi:S-DNA-T family DNA segregation ATPase FtsK/SpoIIIE